MSKSTNDGGPAFPSTVQDDRDCAGRYVGGYGGMSLRDWFAGQALAGIAAKWGVDGYHRDSDLAADCYILADAMLAARSKEGRES